MNNKFVGIEKLSLVDYEGKLACTLFTSGCNFRCVFCHNSSLALNNNNNIIEDDEIFDYLSKRKKQLDAVVITGGEPTLMQGLEKLLITKLYLNKNISIWLKFESDSKFYN